MDYWTYLKSAGGWWDVSEILSIYDFEGTLFDKNNANIVELPVLGKADANVFALRRIPV